MILRKAERRQWEAGLAFCVVCGERALYFIKPKKGKGCWYCDMHSKQPFADRTTIVSD